jgi:hypothetical protein
VQLLLSLIIVVAVIVVGFHFLNNKVVSDNLIIYKRFLINIKKSLEGLYNCIGEVFECS